MTRHRIDPLRSLTDEEREILEILAVGLIPHDEIDDGLRDVGFAGIIEFRNLYQPLVAELYTIGLRGCQEACLALFGKPLTEVTDLEVGMILGAMAAGTAPGSSWNEIATPQVFFSTLRADACFVYCTSEDVWEKIGFPGPSFDKGGYPDFVDPQI